MSPRPPLIESKFYTLPEGKRLRYALFEPEKARGTMLIAPGRREFIEKKHMEMGEALLQRGFRLIFFEWRGQGLSDRFLTGPKAQHDHCPDFRIHLEDLNSLYEKLVRVVQTGPLLVSGHSMGAHLMMRWLAEYRPNVIGGFFTAPMMALAGGTAHSLARGITWMAMHLHHQTDYAPAQHDYNAHDRSFHNNPLTQDPARFKIIEDYFTGYPEMTVGGVTWGWLDAALKSMHAVHYRRYFEKLTLPVMTITGSADHVTPAAEITRYLKRIPGSENILIPAARHDILNEKDECRMEAWRHIDRFLIKF